MIITNIDAWDRREFIESVEQDKSMQDTEREGSKKQPNFSEFMVDIFGGLYKYDPKQRPENEITTNTAWMDELYNEIKQLPEWTTLRERTKLNSVSAAAATAEFCMRFIDAVPDENEQHDPNNKKHSDPSLTRRVARKACQAAVEEADAINNSIGVIGQGDKPGNQYMASLSDKKEIFRRIRDNKNLKEIMKLAGRFQRLAIDKQKSKTKYGTDEITNIDIGNDLGRLVPSEMMKIYHPLLQLDFKKKYLERNLIQYQLSGRETQGRGPLIICCDESGTMEGKRDIWSKAVALALLRVAQKQKRTFAIIHYDARVHRVDKFKRGKATPIDIIDSMTHFTGGGTNFEHPLNKSVQLINNEKEYKEADIIFVSDGEAQLGDQFLKIFNQAKKIAQFNVISILIDTNKQESTSCKYFSDKIAYVDGNNYEDALDVVFDV